EVVYASWVKVAGLVQGWDLSVDAILQSSPDIVFTSFKTFLASITIIGSFQGVESVNGFNLLSYCGHLLLDKLTVNGAVRFERNVTTGIVHLGQHTIADKAMHYYWMRDQDAVLKGSLELKRVKTQHVTTA
ncbi:hypothetical protein Hamer_G012942, partial [Homarus americanus]